MLISRVQIRKPMPGMNLSILALEDINVNTSWGCWPGWSELPQTPHLADLGPCRSVGLGAGRTRRVACSSGVEQHVVSRRRPLCPDAPRGLHLPQELDRLRSPKASIS